MAKKTFQVMVERDADGIYVAEVPGVCACYAQGNTMEEALGNVKDVLKMCIEEMTCRGEEICQQCDLAGLETIEIEL